MMKYYFLALATGVVVCVGCASDGRELLQYNKPNYVAPPASMATRPGPMVDGPGPGVMAAMLQPQMRAFATKTTQIKFTAPKAMKIGWQIDGGFAEDQIIAPGRYDFRQGATYRLKITSIPGRKLTLYPTLQVYPAHPSTDAYLSHNSIPLRLTEEDLDQIENSNYITKVVYLPDAKYQDLVADVEELVSTRLEPGMDPVAEADKRGTIMVVMRVGNKDLEMGKDAMGPDGASLNGSVNQVSYRVLDGGKGEHAPPVPIAPAGGGFSAIPGPAIVGGYGRPGQPAINPVTGTPGMPVWGQPITGTPIGLPGPPHLPLGGPAGLRQHIVQNNTYQDIGKPVSRFVMEVEHKPGYRMPHPVSYVKYTEVHPNFPDSMISDPANGAGPGGVCPPPR